MEQVTIYIDDQTEKKLAAAAKAMQMSKSRWVNILIHVKVAIEWSPAII